MINHTTGELGTVNVTRLIASQATHTVGASEILLDSSRFVVLNQSQSEIRPSCTQPPWSLRTSWNTGGCYSAKFLYLEGNIAPMQI